MADASRREQLGELAERKIVVNLETDGKKKISLTWTVSPITERCVFNI